MVWEREVYHPCWVNSRLCFEQLHCTLDVETSQNEPLLSGCLLTSTTYRRRSQVSATTSISACQIFFPCPIMTAAINSYLYFLLTSSAARRKIAARCSNGVFSHDDLAAKADEIAFLTSEAVAGAHSAIISLWRDGLI